MTSSVRYPLSRRHFLTGATAAAICGASRVNADDSPRVATLDWAILETLLAMDANVVAGTELRQFREVAVTPQAPSSVADLGLRGSPNLEVLRDVRPSVIFNSNFYGWADERMRPIAPVESYSVYKPGESPYALSEQMALGIDGQLGLTTGRTLVENARQTLDTYRSQFARGDHRSILPVNLGDARHFRVFGADSMFGEVLNRTGLTNAWTDPTSYSATAPVGIERLATMPEAWIVLIPPHPADAYAELQSSRFWQALPAVRDGRVLLLGSINPYGALPAAMRFADLLAEGLIHAWNG